MRSQSICTGIAALLLFGFCTFAYGQKAADLTRFGHDIHVESGQRAGDITCLGCSVFVRGQVAGDITAVKGRIVVEEQAQVAGDVTALAGNVRIDSGSKIAGDVTAVGGSIHRASDVQVSGDVTELPGGAWIALVAAVPLVVMGAILALIVWLVQRGRRPNPVPARA